MSDFSLIRKFMRKFPQNCQRTALHTNPENTPEYYIKEHWYSKYSIFATEHWFE